MFKGVETTSQNADSGRASPEVTKKICLMIMISHYIQYIQDSGFSREELVLKSEGRREERRGEDGEGDTSL